VGVLAARLSFSAGAGKGTVWKLKAWAIVAGVCVCGKFGGAIGAVLATVAGHFICPKYWEVIRQPIGDFGPRFGPSNKTLLLWVFLAVMSLLAAIYLWSWWLDKQN
jgi:hypothetical protein